MRDPNPAAHSNVHICCSIITNTSILEVFGELAYTESLTGAVMKGNASIVESTLRDLFCEAALIEPSHFISEWR